MKNIVYTINVEIKQKMNDSLKWIRDGVCEDIRTENDDFKYTVYKCLFIAFLLFVSVFSGNFVWLAFIALVAFILTEKSPRVLYYAIFIVSFHDIFREHLVAEFAIIPTVSHGFHFLPTIYLLIVAVLALRYMIECFFLRTQKIDWVPIGIVVVFCLFLLIPRGEWRFAGAVGEAVAVSMGVFAYIYRKELSGKEMAFMFFMGIGLTTIIGMFEPVSERLQGMNVFTDGRFFAGFRGPINFAQFHIVGLCLTAVLWLRGDLKVLWFPAMIFSTAMMLTPMSKAGLLSMAFFYAFLGIVLIAKSIAARKTLTPRKNATTLFCRGGLVALAVGLAALSVFPYTQRTTNRLLGDLFYRPACPMVWGAWTTDPTRGRAPTCLEEGYEIKIRHCTRCNTKYQDEQTNILPATGHNLVWTTITPPTCTEAGQEVGTCAGCGHTETRPIPQSHNWGAWQIITPATCTTPGLMQRHCQTSTCAHYESHVIPAGHNMVWTIITPPTCKEPGLERGECAHPDCTHYELRPIPPLALCEDLYCDTCNPKCATNPNECDRTDCHARAPLSPFRQRLVRITTWRSEIWIQHFEAIFASPRTALFGHGGDAVLYLDRHFLHPDNRTDYHLTAWYNPFVGILYRHGLLSIALFCALIVLMFLSSKREGKTFCFTSFILLSPIWIMAFSIGMLGMFFAVTTILTCKLSLKESQK